MGRLLDRLKVTCRQCSHEHIPRRIRGRFLDGEKERVNLWVCKECGYIWIDSAFKKKPPTQR